MFGAFRNLPIKFKFLTCLNFTIGLVYLQQFMIVVLTTNSFQFWLLFVAVFIVLCFLAVNVSCHQDYLSNKNKQFLSFLPLTIFVLFYSVCFLLMVKARFEGQVGFDFKFHKKIETT